MVSQNAYNPLAQVQQLRVEYAKQLASQQAAQAGGQQQQQQAVRVLQQPGRDMPGSWWVGLPIWGCMLGLL
jgi:hypothetical protein